MDLLEHAVDLLDDLINQARSTGNTMALGPLVEAQNIILKAVLHTHP